MAVGAECASRNLVAVMCSHDMGSQKRGKAHNLSRGHGEVLGVATRNKTCRTCAASKKDNKHTPHECRKDNSGSSKIMVSNVVCEVFKCAPPREIKYNRYIGDDDSTTFTHPKTNVPYGLEKFSDFVPTKCSLNTRLYKLSQRSKFPNSSVPSRKVGNCLVKCFAYCVHQHKNQSEELAKAIQCIVPHAFGDHNKCNVLWCPNKQNPAEYTPHELP